MNIMNVIIVAVFLLALILLLTVAWSSISLAPFVPTRKKDIQRIRRLAELKSNEIFYDLGSGNGRVVIGVAEKSTGKAVGIEAAWPVWAYSKIRAWFTENKNIEFKFGNLFKEDLSHADVVYFFGMPNSVKSRLKGKLERELKSGARVISYAFSVPGWHEEKIDKPRPKDISIYLYKML